MVSGASPTAPATPVAVEAWRLLRAISHDPAVLRRGHDLAESEGTTPTIAKALAHLSATRPTPMRELAGALRCDTSYVTSVVDGMEEQGLARRAAHPTDRRVKVVELTERGSEVAARVRAALDEPPVGFAALDDGEASALLALLRKVSASGA